MFAFCMLAALRPNPAAAQTPCATSFDTWWTTIIIKNNAQGVCVVDPYGGQYAARIRTDPGGPVVWHVCNTCGSAADVRLSNFTTEMQTLLSTFLPMPDAANSVTRRNIPDGMNYWTISARATSDETYLGSHDYDVFVKLTSEDDTKWRQFHPQLQIERDGLAPAILSLLLGVTAFVGAALGYWFGRRRLAR
jgi:hypothetical protein